MSNPHAAKIPPGSHTQIQQSTCAAHMSPSPTHKVSVRSRTMHFPCQHFLPSDDDVEYKEKKGANGRRGGCGQGEAVCIIPEGGYTSMGPKAEPKKTKAELRAEVSVEGPHVHT